MTKTVRTLLIDNFDSFTFNLFQELAIVNGESPLVIRNNEYSWDEIKQFKFDNIVISPGPGHPDRESDFGVCREVILGASVPVLGVCLGHQGIARAFGAQVLLAPEPRHGRPSLVAHEGTKIFAGLPSPFSVIRYHSWMVDSELSPELRPLAWSDDGVLMGLEHRTRPLWGVQFHPESICTEFGRKLLENFRDLTFAFAEERNDAYAEQAGSRLFQPQESQVVEPSLRTLPQFPERRLYQSSRPQGETQEMQELGASLLGEEAPQRFFLRMKKLDLLPDAEGIFTRLFAGSDTAFWLDSEQASRELSRFSFMGDASGPLAEVLSYRSRERELKVERREGGEAAGESVQVSVQVLHESVFDYLQRQIRARAIDVGDLPFDFNGGYVGYFGYELRAECGVEGVVSSTRMTSETPDAKWIFADRMIAIDHQEQASYLVQVLNRDLNLADAESWEREIERALFELHGLRSSQAIAPKSKCSGLDSSGGLPRVEIELDAQGRHLIAKTCLPLEQSGSKTEISFQLRDSRTDVEQKIRECLRQIREGESYEICLTNSLTGKSEADPFLIYRALRAVNPSPYGAFFKFRDLEIMSSSPERFLKISSDGWMEAKPIKGTAPRGRDEAEDLRFREALRTSEKDRAENLMIVDLLRNDLGSVAEVGTVHVPKLMDIEAFPSVLQMVSTVRGRLREGRTPLDAVRACFPGGSMTGAPKHRTLEIIETLEAAPRGIYSGAIGFLALGGAVDLNIVIRTIVASSSGLSIGVGGAIVALSDADAEFEETVLKARASLSAIALAELAFF